MSDQRSGVELAWWLSSEEHDPRAIVGHARLAETIGIRTALLSDHLHPWVPRQGHSPHAWAVAGGVLAATEQLHVATAVTAMVNRRDPVDVAHAAATLAVLSRDRFTLGVGLGERLNESGDGRPWLGAAHRRAQLDESVGVIRRLWSGELVHHRGAHWVIDGVRLYTRPAHPPAIHVAAGGPKAAALAGAIGDGLITVTPDHHLVERFRGSGGTGPRTGQLHVSLARTRDEALDQAWAWWPHGVLPPSLLGELARPEHIADAARAIGREAITATVVCTDRVDTVVAAIDRFVGAGIDTVAVHQVGPDQARLAEAMRTELLPHYRVG